MNTVIVKINDATQTIDQISVVTKDGVPTVITATNKVNYEFHDTAIGRAPNHIITKRVKNDLHVSFEKEGQESDLIIEGFYDNTDSALLGIAEDGEYYYYIPDTGETYDYVTQLEEGAVEGQALGGQEYATIIPWWIPAAAGLGLVGLIAGNSNSSSDKTPVAPPVNKPPVATDDVAKGETGQPVIIDVVANDSDPENDLDPTTVKLIDPVTGNEVTNVVVDGEGTWSVDGSTGKVIFTPVSGFTADPTPVDYVVSDKTGEKSNQATIAVDYPVIVSITGTASLNEMAADGTPNEATYTVSISNPSTEDTVVTVTISDGSTEGSADYTAPVTQNVTIPAGQTSVDITVPIVNDNVFEGPEDFNVAVTAVTAGTATIGTNNSVTTTIYDDGTTNGTDPVDPTDPTVGDDTPIVSITGTASLNEMAADGTPNEATYTVSISNPSTEDTVVTVTISDGSTEGSADYTAPVTQNVTIPAGQTSVDITVPIVNDNVFEGPEDFNVAVTAVTAGTATIGTNNSVTTTIYDDGTTNGTDPVDPTDPTVGDDTPIVSITGTASLNEMAADGTPNEATYTVSISNPSTEDTVVTVTISDGSTEGSADYTAPVTQNVTIPAGQTSVDITVPIVNDNVFEGPEDFNVAVTAVTAGTATIGTNNSVTTTIYDDGTTNGTDPVDPTDPTVGDDTPIVSITGTASLNEMAADGTPNEATYTVSISNPSTEDTVVTVTISDGSTEGSADYTAPVTQNVTIPAGQTSVDITVPIVNDNVFEGPEDFNVAVTAVTAGTATIGTNNSVTTTIYDDGTTNGTDPVDPTDPTVGDDTPIVSITGTASLNEMAADGTPNEATYTVSISNPSTEDTVVTVTISDGSTEGSADYTAPVTQNVTIPAGQTSVDITVPIVNDNVFEGPEDFNVAVTAVTAGTATIGTNNSVTTTIYDDGTTNGTDPVDPTDPTVGDDTPIVSITGTASLNEMAADGTPNEATYTVSISNPSTEDTVVTVTISDGSTEGSADYTAPVTQNVTIPAGQTSVDITVPIVNDNVFEGPEDFNVAVTAVTAGTATIGTNNSVTTTIYDDGTTNGTDPVDPTDPTVGDDTPIVSITGTASLNEMAADGTPNEATYTVSISNPSTEDTVVTVTISDGSTEGSADYTAPVTQNVTIPAGQTSVDITVPIVNDNVFEGPEDFNVAVTAVTAGTATIGTNNSVTTTIYDDGTTNGTDPVDPTDPTVGDDTPIVSITGTASLNEMAADGTPNEATYTVSISNPSTEDTVVTVTISDGSTEGSADYTAPVTQNVTIPAGQTSVDITVPIVNDNVFEGPEDFNVAVTAVTAGTATIGTNNSVTTTIYDDGTTNGTDPVDPTDPTVGDDTPIVSITGTASLNEMAADGTPNEATYTVSISNPSTEDTVVTVTISDGSTEGSADYTAPVTQNVTIPAGQTSVDITVPIVNDNVFEGPEDFNVAVTAVTAGTATIGTNNSVTTTIYDDGTTNGTDPVDPTDPTVGDDTPIVSITGTASLNEMAADGTPNEATYTVSISNPSTEDTVVTVTISDGSTEGSADYTAPVTQNVTIPAGQTSVDITVPIVNDNVFEGPEDFNVAVTAVTAGTATIGTNNSVTTTIYDDGTTNGTDPVDPTDPTVGDDTPIVSITGTASLNEMAADGTPNEATYTVSISNPSTEDTVVTVTISDGSTEGSADYTAPVTQNVTIPAGQTSVDITVPIVNDNVFEGPEDFNVAVTAVTAGTATIGTNNSVTTTIYDDGTTNGTDPVDPTDPTVGDDTPIVSITGTASLNEMAADGTPNEATYTVSISNPSTEDTVVTVTISDGSTEGSADYTAPVTQNVTIPAGQTSVDITVPIVNDNVFEGPEDFNVAVTAVTAGTATIGTNNSVTTTIYDDGTTNGTDPVDPTDPTVGDDTPIVSITGTASLNEMAADGTPNEATYTVSISNPSTEDTVVTVTISDGSTEGSADYTAPVTQNVTIPAGQTSVDITVPIVNDNVFEGPEDFNVAVTAVTAGTATIGTNNSVTTTIYDDGTTNGTDPVDPTDPTVGDDTPIVSITGTASLNEMAADGTPNEATYTVSISNPSTEDTVVTVTISDGSTEGSADYTAPVTQNVTIPAGQTSVDITVPIVNDNVFEGPEDFNVAVTAVTAGTATIGTNNSVTTTIYDDGTTNGTDPVDPTDPTVGDDTPIVSITGTASLNEMAADGTPNEATYTVSISNPSTEDTVVTVTISDGSTEGSADYTAPVTQNVTIPAGQTSVDITVPIVNDNVFEGPEDFNVAVTAVTAGTATIGTNNSVTTTIYDDGTTNGTDPVDPTDPTVGDDTPIVSITGTASLNEMAADGTPNEATYTVSISNPSTEDTVVTVTISDGSTEGSADYTAPVTQNVTIPAGQTSVDITVPIVNDNVFEGPEDFNVAVTAVTAGTATIGTNNSVTTTIYDDGTTNGTDPVDPTDPTVGDDTPIVSITGTASLNEMAADGTPNEATYTVSISNPSTEDTVVTVTISDGSTEGSADYTAPVTQNVTIPAGQTSVDITVPIVNDNVFEGPEDFNVAVTAVTAGTATIGTNNSVTTTIYDDGTTNGTDPVDPTDPTVGDDTPIVSITGTASLNEMAADGTPNEATYTVSISNPSTEDTVVTVTISDGSTEGSADYTAPVTQNVTIPAGQTSVDITVPIVNDNVFEGPEDFNVAVTAVTAGTATIGTNNSVTTTIYDDGTTNGTDPVDPTDPTVGDDTPIVSITGTASLNEMAADGTPNEATYTVSISNPSTEDTVVTVTISDGSTEGSADYTAPVTQNVTIPAGQTSVDITVPIVNDNVFEGPEDFNVAVTAVTAGTATIGTNNSVTTTIYDDGTTNGTDPVDPTDPTVGDDTPIVSITGTASLNEMAADGTPNEATYTVSISNPSTEDTVVTVTISDGSTEGSADYTAPVTQNVTIPAGQTSVDITVPIVNDNVFEGPEDFNVAVTAVTAGTATIGTNNSVTTTIYDDGTTNGTDPVDPTDPTVGDDTPIVSITGTASLNEMAADGTPNEATYTVSISNPSTEDTVVTVTISDGSTEGSADYTAPVTQNVTIPAGQTSVDITVPIVNDNVFEGPEDFNVAVTAVTAGTATIGTNNSVTTTIYDDGTTNGTDPVDPTDPTVGDDTPIVSITGTASLNEMAADGTPNEATYTVSISNPSTEDTVVTVTISDGSTEGSADYTAPVTQNVTIPAGQTSVDITVPIVNDNVFEGPEDFNVAVTAVTAGTATIGTNNSVTTTIYDDGTTNGTDPVDPTDPTVGDDTPIVSITGTASLNEMAADGTPNEATYTVSISNPSTEDTVVTVTISDGSTEGSADYTAPVTQNVTIPAGQTSVDITVPIVNDNVFEGPEDFNVAVTAVTAGTATIGTNNSVTTTIYDDGTTNGTDPVDPTDPTVGDDTPIVSITGTASLNEMAADGTPNEATYTVSISNPSTEDTVVTVTISDGSTEGSADYTAPVTQNVTIPAGQTSVDITVPIVNDNVFEGPEDFNVAVTAVTAGTATIGTNNSVTTTIYDDGTTNGTDPVDPTDPTVGDDTPIVSITGTASLNEMAADGTPNEATYTVSISNPSTEDTVVTVTISDGSTEGSADYTAPVTQNVTIPAGQTSVDITVPIVNDNVFEGPEDFNVAVTAVTAGTATIGTNNSVTTTIYDDGTTNGTDPVDPTDPTVGDDRSTAPVAVDDLETGLVGSPVTVAVVGNDTDAEGDLDPTTVMITVSPAGSTIAADGKSVDVSGEGVWTVNPTTGDITFTPETGFTGDPTPISYTVDDLTGKTSNEATVTIDYDQPTNISVSSPARVSEEGLAGGNPDTNPDSTLDTTDSATDTDNNWIRVTDTDTDLSNSVVNFVLPTAVQNITSQGNPVDFRIDSATGNIVGEYTYTDSAGAPQVQNVLTISLNGNKEAITDGYQFGYDVVLGAPVDHILGDNTEGVLPVSFGIEVFENATATESLAKSDELLVIVEDDSPLPQPVVWNIDVQQETITINGLQTGFDETLFTRPTRAGYLIADADNVAAGSTGTTVESRNYGGTIGILSAEQDATYQAGDGNTYVDSLDEGIYWGRPAGTTPPAGYTTYENTNYQGAGQGVKFETDIDLGNFSHINFSIYGDGGTLIETNLNVDFTIDVNGNSEPISVDYLLKHNETPNGNTAEFYGLTSAEYDATFVASDFIIIPNASRVITIAGQQYKLDLELVNKDPNAAVDSDRNKTFLKAYQTKINGSYDPALDDEGTFVVNSEEGKENTYDVIGKLTPLNPLPELADNVVIAGQVAVGADAVDYTNPTGTGIVWSGTSTTGANGIAIMDTDSDMTNYEFKTDYGVFVGYANGSYKFSAAKNISEIVSPGQDDIDVFSFTYKDADGDTATSTVTLNYNEYATPQNPNSIDNLAPRGTDNNDYLLGTNQAETLNGGAGNDTLVGLSGADTLLGGEGSDTIVFDKNDVSIDGGTNLDGSQENDTLVITDTSIIASNDMNNVTNFETLDLTNNTAQTLNLNLSDVISMTDGNNQLFIKGDSVDTVNVSGMTKSGTSDQAGYDLYQDAGSIAQLYIQTDIIDNVI